MCNLFNDASMQPVRESQFSSNHIITHETVLKTLIDNTFDNNFHWSFTKFISCGSPTETCHWQKLTPEFNSFDGKLYIHGRLSLNPCSGLLTLKPVNDNCRQDATPIFISRSSAYCRLFFGIPVVGRCIAVYQSSQLAVGSTVTSFGHRMTPMKYFYLLDSLQPISVKDSDEYPFTLVEDSQLEPIEMIVFLRYVSALSLSTSGFENINFSFKYELISTRFHDTSTPIKYLHLSGQKAFEDYWKGIFLVGNTLQLQITEIVNASDSRSAKLLSASVIKQPFLHDISICRHLFGLFQLRVFSVSDAKQLLRTISASDELLSIASLHRQFRINLQGYLYKHAVENTKSNSRQCYIWLIDKASASLNSDIITSIKIKICTCEDWEQITTMLFLSHICLFKLRLVWIAKTSEWTLVLPLSPNRFQVSPQSSSFFQLDEQSNVLNANPDYLSTSCIDKDSMKKPLIEERCPICAEQTKHSQYESITSPCLIDNRTSFFSESESLGKQTAQIFFVHIIKCFDLTIRFGELERKSNVSIKLLVSDGSGSAIVSYQNFSDQTKSINESNTSFSTIHSDTKSDNFQADLTVDELYVISHILGLEKSLILRLIGSVRQLFVDRWSLSSTDNQPTLISDSPLRASLHAWLECPGFQRPVYLSLVPQFPNQNYSRKWRLRTIRMGDGVGEIRLTVPPHRHFCVAT